MGYGVVIILLIVSAGMTWIALVSRSKTRRRLNNEIKLREYNRQRTKMVKF